MRLNNDKVVRVTCWCEEQFVWVPIEEVWAGLTNPCKLDPCRDQNQKARRKQK